MTKAARLLLLILVTFGFFFSSIHTTRAFESLDYNENSATFQKDLIDGQNSKSNLNYTAMNFMMANLSGIGFIAAGCSDAVAECPTKLADGGALGSVGKMIASTFSHQPASVDTYIADLKENMGIGVTQQAYAQGLGFSSLEPILGLWKIFRNIAYVFFVFLFLIIGFGIIFRQNLGGQTAVTVQQALPRIIVALLAVSFSYAIAGLLIDLMWLSMYFLITMFRTGGLQTGGKLVDYSMLNDNIFTVFLKVITNGFASASGQVIGKLVEEMIRGSGEGVQGFFASLAGGVANILATLIVLFAILFAMFRTFFSLIKVYFEIILQIVFAPVILMMGAINGNAFGNWLKGLLANLAVFPVLLVFILVGFMLVDSNNFADQLNNGGFIPPFVPGRGAGNAIGMIGGIAAIMLLPEVVNMVGKFKPSSIFDEFGPKAWENAMKGRNAGLTVAAAPAIAVGGYAGMKFATGKANELGLKGNARRLAQLGGFLGGAAVVPNLPRIIASAPATLGRQLGEAQTQKFLNDVKRQAARRRKEDATLKQQELAAKNAEIINNNKGKQADVTTGTNRGSTERGL